MPKASQRPQDPEHLTISKSQGITIEWKDGHSSHYELKYLRACCPCADCSGAHGPKSSDAKQDSPFALYKPALRIEKAESVGNYAIRIRWSDGHDAGIYSYEHLRDICHCPKCTGEESAP